MLKLLLLATALTIHASPVSHDAPSSNTPLDLAKRGGPCHQGDCPDFHAAFDLYYRRSIIPVNSTYIYVQTYEGRVNDCGKCQKIFSNSDGCFDFNSCGRDQNICVDYRNSRAHRIYKDTGHKNCYHIKAEYFGNCGISTTNSAVYHPDKSVACTW